MKHMELLLRLQRMLDEETPEGDLEGLDEVAAELNEPADLGPESADLEELGPMLEGAGGMESETENAPGDVRAEMEGIDDSLGVGDLFGAMEENEGRSGDLRRLEKLLQSSPGPRGGRPGGRGRFPRLERLFQVLQEFQDRKSGTGDVRRLRRLMTSRSAAGGFGAFDAADDPVVVRRRAQIKEFLGAWREALKDSRAAEARKSAEARRGPAPSPAATGEAGTTGADPAASAPEPTTADRASADPALDKKPRRSAPSSRREPGSGD